MTKIRAKLSLLLSELYYFTPYLISFIEFDSVVVQKIQKNNYTALKIYREQHGTSLSIAIQLN